jgi:hypothetical protein
MASLPKKRLIISAAVLIVAAVGVYAWHVRHGNPEAQTASKQPSAQSNFTSGGAHASSPNSGVTQGGATDNQGDKSATPSETGVTSTSGVVTVVAPASGGSLVSGDTVRGTANGVGKVQYRIVDDNVGVVAQGSLDVVDGAFSGTMQFKAYATTGQLEVFTFNNQDQEVNEVRLPVALKP